MFGFLMGEVPLYVSSHTGRGGGHVCVLDKYSRAAKPVKLLFRQHSWETRATLANDTNCPAPRVSPRCTNKRVFRYRGTSLIKKRHTLGPYSRLMPRVLGGPRVVGVLL